MKKRMAKTIMVLMAMAFVMLSLPLNTRAQDALAGTQFSQFMTTAQQIDAKEEPDENAGTAFTYEAGATVYVTGETEDGWYSVLYQGKTGYININSAKGILAVTEIDVEALNAEMAAQEAESKLIVEETERYRAEARRSKIWGAVIVLLVIGIFATGIISTVQAEKKKNEGAEKDKSIKEDKIKVKEQKIEDKKEEAEEDDIWDLDKE